MSNSLTVEQRRRNVAEYAVEFCNLAAGRWNEPALKAAFYQDLNQ